MVLVFDLDDTLYDELQFVRSGFRAVAELMEKTWAIKSRRAYQQMIEKLTTAGRGRIFDEVLKSWGHYSQRNVRRCLTTYRLHRPVLKLDPQATACLGRFRAYPLYIVTDGHKIVQKNKIIALGLDKRVKKYFLTHQHGRHRAKPSPYCFEKIRALEKCRSDEIIYVGDNPAKDFTGIKKLGFRTIRLMRGAHQKVELTAAHEADLRIKSLDQLTVKLVESWRPSGI